MTQNPKLMGLVFANTHEEQVAALTQKRCMAALPFGGRYRLIDFTLSNLSAAEITKVGVIAKKNYMSLMHHMESGKSYDLARKNGGLFTLPPNVTGTEKIYHGHIQAIYDIYDFLDMASEDYVVLADADVVSNIDLKGMFEQHIKTGADITIAYKHGKPPIGHGDTMAFTFDADGRVTDVALAPDTATECDYSLDIAIFNKRHLIRLVEDAAASGLESISKDIYSRLFGVLNMRGYEVDNFTVVIDSVKSFFDGNMALLESDNRRDLFHSNHTVMTKVQDEIPVIYGLEAKVNHSLIADGCVIDGIVENSILFRNVKVKKGAVIRNSIVLSDSIIEEGATLNFVCAERMSTVEEGKALVGTQNEPYLLLQNQ